jgi:DNA-binding MarR family transcriptional regulator
MATNDRLGEDINPPAALGERALDDDLDDLNDDDICDEDAGEAGEADEIPTVTHRRRGRRPDRRRPPVFVSLHGAYHALSQRVQLASEPSGLSPTEFAVLVAADRDPGTTIAALRQATGLRPSTMTAVLDRLQRRGLVTRSRQRGWGRRVVYVHLSKIGSVVAGDARTALEQIDEELDVFASARELAGPAVDPRGDICDGPARAGGRLLRGWDGPRVEAQGARLQRTHGGLLDRVRVVPAANVEGAMCDEEAQLVGGRPPDATSLPAAALARLFDDASDRNDDISQVNASTWRAHEQRGGPPGRGRFAALVWGEGLRGQERKREDVRGAGVAHVLSIEPGELAVVGQNEPD